MALLPGGGYSDIARVHKDHLMKIPSNLDFKQAAAIPETWLTSYQLLYKVAKAQKGDIWLVHAAASGIGCAVIQLCKQFGIVTIAVSSTEEKLDYAKSLGANFTINYKENPDFSGLVREYTENKGVNLILDCVAAQNFDANLKSAAIDWQWVLYGGLGGMTIPEFNMGKFMAKRIQFLSTTLKTRSNQYKADLIEDFSKNCLHIFETEDFKPIIDKTYNFTEMSQAHERMESNVNIGKIVCINDM